MLHVLHHCHSPFQIFLPTQSTPYFRVSSTKEYPLQENNKIYSHLEEYLWLGMQEGLNEARLLFTSLLVYFGFQVSHFFEKHDILEYI
jgi:hypothetical protein